MEKRKYVQMGKYEERIREMREEGRTTREIAEELGLERKQIRNWISRHNRKESELAQGIISQKKGKPRSRPLSQRE